MSLLAVSWTSPGNRLGSRVHVLAPADSHSHALCGIRVPYGDREIREHTQPVRFLPVCEPCRARLARGRYATARLSLPEGVLAP